MFNHKLNKPITDNSLTHSNLPFAKDSIIFAPMEGVTNYNYRKVISKIYPEWDALCCDFIRIPSNGLYPLKYLIKHIGAPLLASHEIKKTMVQILTSPIANTIDTVLQLKDLGIYWLDLNLGCPSGTVVKHQGGSYWLKNPKAIFQLVEKIRIIHPFFFSIKMRVGFEDDQNFLEIIQGLEKIGVDAITIHARTRQQMYSTPADWKYIAMAAANVSIPIIGNGDLWTKEDCKRMLNQTGCHSVMVARGALKSPWLPQMNSTTNISFEIKRYFDNLVKVWQENEVFEKNMVKKIKELSRYLFEDMDNGASIKRSILLAANYQEQFEVINQLYE